MSLVHSDLYLLSQFIQQPDHCLDPMDLYRIVAAGSSQNLQLPEVKFLNPKQKALVQIRNKIFQGVDQPQTLIRELDQLANQYTGPADICFSDIQAIKANLLQRIGDYEGASCLQMQASQLFYRLGDVFRGLRAVINSKMYHTSSASSYQTGELRILLQQAHRQGFYDLAGHIYRGLALELFNTGEYAQARIAIHAALANYRLLSYPDDESIALFLSTLINLQLNHFDKAKKDFDRAPIRTGKALIYYQAARSCLSGLVPKISNEHPLSRAQWKKTTFRKNSLPSRLIELLTNSPLTRDELIYTLWGETAISESYCNRLYVLLNQIRKKNLAQIIFNGEKYELKVT